MTTANPPPQEDIWAFGPIGSPFPDSPVHALGQANMYVALWYKHGRPVHGRAWNNGGILQYKGDHNSLGFWYEWIKYKDRFEKAEERQMLKCGDSLPILWKDRKEGAILGYLDNSTEFVSVCVSSFGKKKCSIG
uniref:Uncharacterized protein n=1 Tax=Parascaris equorum TaxID=6256 RepID=A0A914RL46_PAREQ